jgi:Ca2+-binding RTX toxin-like protein
MPFAKPYSPGLGTSSPTISELTPRTINGTAADETLSGRSGDDTVNGGGGNDTLFGKVGSDHLDGGPGADRLYGGDDPDYLWGGTENDQLYGENADDTLGGEDGNDLLMGGLGADQMIGGTGQDTFYYNDAINESPATSSHSDRILDFHYNGDNDKVDLPIAGTADNFLWEPTEASSMDEAQAEANQNHSNKGLTYVYLANEKEDTGYLLADLNGTGNFETGITFVGAGEPGEFNYDAIV